jgi:hypothetical protein
MLQTTNRKETIMNQDIEFNPFPKMARLSREAIISEKIDGTNAQVLITEDGGFYTGSRNRWITPDNDNFGFSAWAHENKEELMKLGVGRHFGEWWGQGIQRKYGLDHKRWSLFNTLRWHEVGQEARRVPMANPTIEKWTEEAPACCHVVPILYSGTFCTDSCEDVLTIMRVEGSFAAPGFMKPEGIVVYHVAAGVGFKKTIEDDHIPKGISG